MYLKLQLLEYLVYERVKIFDLQNTIHVAARIIRVLIKLISVISSFFKKYL